MRLFGMRLFTFGSALVVLSACTGSMNSLPGSRKGPYGVQSSQLPALPTITRAFLATAPHIALPSSATHLPSADALIRGLGEPTNTGVSEEKVRLGSSAGSGDSETVGVKVNPGGPYTGIVAFQSAYMPFAIPNTGSPPQIQIGYPPGASGPSTLLAPFASPSNGSCLAAGSV